jgi:hypothetical protein
MEKHPPKRMIEEEIVFGHYSCSKQLKTGEKTP